MAIRQVNIHLMRFNTFGKITLRKIFNFKKWL